MSLEWCMDIVRNDKHIAENYLRYTGIAITCHK